MSCFPEQSVSEIFFNDFARIDFSIQIGFPFESFGFFRSFVIVTMPDGLIALTPG